MEMMGVIENGYEVVFEGEFLVGVGMGVMVGVGGVIVVFLSGN